MISKKLKAYLSDYSFDDGKPNKPSKQTIIEHFEVDGQTIPRFINEFWTSRQRQNNPLHEISYRACFKAELPRFFINLFTKENDIVYDPFAGRGTTIIEAAFLNRKVISNDINPLSTILCRPRLFIPSYDQVSKRLEEIKFRKGLKAEIDLSMFYHPDTESEIVSLKSYLIKRNKKKEEDFIDDWIRMIATNRLTGHSTNFFSVYTLPPNQAVTQSRQKKINMLREQTPSYKDVKKIIIKKTRDLTKGIDKSQVERLKKIGTRSLFINNDARATKNIKKNSVNLTVTSPPFLDIVNYIEDNWLRCWFNNIKAEDVTKKLTITKKLNEWESVMAEVFIELYRITKKGGYVAFEVGEVRKGKIKLDEHVVPLGINAGFDCLGVVINLQKFTKTANIWGIDNNTVGTNTNRIVLFRKN